VASIDATPVSESAYPTRAAAWYATFVLAMLYWLSVLDRFIVSLLVEPIKRDLGLTDMQFGMVYGAGFALTFAILGLVCGALADRFSRRWLIFAGVSVWSLATAALGFAQNFWQLLVARLGVGAGEAALNPCATSMITDLFPRERLTLAMALYTLGATLGGGTAFMVGGALIDLVSHSDVVTLPLIGNIRSWQAVFVIVGLPGLLLALMVFTLPDPARRGRVGAPAWRNAYGGLLKFMNARRRFFVCHYLGFGLASAIIAGCGAWFPAHMGRAFGWSASQIGLSLGMVLIGAGIIGKVVCGHAVDAMYRRGMRDAQLRWYAGALLLGTPIGILATRSHNPWVFLGGVGLFLVLIAPLPACANTALNLVTPNQMRGTGIALFSASGSLIGVGTGPVVIAATAQYFFSGPTAIGSGMSVVIAVIGPLTAVILLLGLRAMRDAMAEAELTRPAIANPV
jgi:MFS family permease